LIAASKEAVCFSASRIETNGEAFVGVGAAAAGWAFAPAANCLNDSMIQINWRQGN
jgi:hypothetical protein